jgi:ADP-ribose pyrophosphatase
VRGRGSSSSKTSALSRKGTTPSPDEALVERREVHAGRLLCFVVDRVRLPDGSILSREVVLHSGAAGVLPLLPDGRVLLVRQHRHAVGKSLWEIPAGKLEAGEESLSCAKRELLEETGCEAASWERISSFYTSPGFTDERMTLFLARDVESIADRSAGEISTVQAFEREEIDRLIREGAIEDAKTLLALLHVRLLE